MSGTTSPNRLAGITSITIGGSSYDLVSAPKWSVATFEREYLKNLSGPNGYKETYTVGFISATLRDNSAITVADFNAMTNETVVLTLANGKVVSGEGLVCVTAVEVDAEEGTFDVRFEGLVAGG